MRFVNPGAKWSHRHWYGSSNCLGAVPKWILASLDVPVELASQWHIVVIHVLVGPFAWIVGDATSLSGSFWQNVSPGNLLFNAPMSCHFVLCEHHVIFLIYTLSIRVQSVPTYLGSQYDSNQSILYLQVVKQSQCACRGFAALA